MVGSQEDELRVPLSGWPSDRKTRQRMAYRDQGCLLQRLEQLKILAQRTERSRNCHNSGERLETSS